MLLSALAEVRRKLHELKRMEAVLQRLVASCGAREATKECPILEVLVEVEHA